MPIKEEQSTSRQHPVPQNVMDVEFKVVGDLTVRQLMYLFAGMILVYLFYKSDLPSFWRYIFVSISGSLSIAVAFIPIQERGLDKWLISFVKSMLMPTQMVWRKAYSPPAYFLADYAEIIKNEIITLTPAKSRNKLDEYLGQLQETQTDLDLLAINKLKNIDAIFLQPYNSKLPEVSIGLTAKPLTGRDEQIVETITITEPKNNKKIPNRTQIAQDELESKQEVIESIGGKQFEIISSGPIDRPMANLPVELKGEIKIETTTRIPKTIVAQDIKTLKSEESSLEKKVAELLAVAQKAKQQIQEGEEKNPRTQARIEFFNNKYNQLKEERESLSSQLAKSTSRVSNLAPEKNNTELEAEIAELAIKNDELSARLAAIQKELFELKNPGKTTISLEENNEKNVADSNAQNLHIPHQTRRKQVMTADQLRINVIHGTVKGKKGELIEDAVVIIKDAEGDVIRALKTNKLGQFKTQTSLSNGTYTIEVIKGGEKFDIISVEAMGQPISAINLIANE